MQRGNQHGSCKYDDLQNWLDMTSHENPLLIKTTTLTYLKSLHREKQQQLYLKLAVASTCYMTLCKNLRKNLFPQNARVHKVDVPARMLNKSKIKLMSLPI